MKFHAKHCSIQQRLDEWSGRKSSLPSNTSLWHRSARQWLSSFFIPYLCRLRSLIHKLIRFQGNVAHNVSISEWATDLLSSSWVNKWRYSRSLTYNISQFDPFIGSIFHHHHCCYVARSIQSNEENISANFHSLHPQLLGRRFFSIFTEIGFICAWAWCVSFARFTRLMQEIAKRKMHFNFLNTQEMGKEMPLNRPTDRHSEQREKLECFIHQCTHTHSLRYIIRN